MSRVSARVRSIAWPIFALVIASVIGATIILFVVTFSGRPPMEQPRPIAEIASMLRTGDRPMGPGGDLTLTHAPSAPTLSDGERPDPKGAAIVARLLSVPITDVRASIGWQPHPGGDDRIGPFTFAWHAPDGWQIVRSPPRPLLTRWHWATLSAMLIAILALSLPAWALARAISRPLQRLADAADQARAGAALSPLPGGGSREVRHLTAAISTMHARLIVHAEGRTTMLGAIAHDLGTPLSRLAFWVEQLPEAARIRAAADIDEMRAMIAATLVFARDETGQHAATRMDLGSLLDSLVEDMAVTGAPVTLQAGARAIVRGDPGTLRRLFANLIDNAIRYGDRAEIGWVVAASAVTVTIDDAGPGVDPAQAESLFEPFVRGDPSRNRATGGTGLGLAIVRSLAARHGGTATLGNGSIGARATVTLPLA